MKILGNITVAGEIIELVHDPRLNAAAIFVVSEIDNQARILIRDPRAPLTPNYIVHELVHAIMWCHGLQELLRSGVEEAIAAALEISLLSASEQAMKLLPSPSPSS